MCRVFNFELLTIRESEEEMKQTVGAILLDASVLLADDGGADNVSLRPGTDSLLRTLRYSKLLTGISYEQELLASKVNLLQEIARMCSFPCFIWKSSSDVDFLSELELAWGHIGGFYVHVFSSHKADLFLNLKDSCRLIVLLRSVGEGSVNAASENSKAIFIDKLEELPLTICCLNKKAIVEEKIKVVGYTMKPSREEDFAKRGAFPLCPTENGLMFFPLKYEIPLSSQLKQVDVVLHKATDDIITVEMSSSDEFIDKITYTTGMQELQRCIQCQPGGCIIDPFDKIYPVLDRLRIQHVLLSLKDLNTEGRSKIRGPHFLKVSSFNEPNLEEKLVEAKLSLPNIVKPQVGCGVADAHSMAIVFKVDDYKGLNVPLPAIVQEYVDHSSRIFKFYVVGRKVFHAVKKSTPNADTLVMLSEGLRPLLFDSLKSLPVVKENQQSVDCKHDAADAHSMDLGLVTDAANWLREILNLTVFGFDVVIQEGTGDHVIVDVNYLPSFKEVPDDVAIPAFWEAIKERSLIQERASKQQ